MSMFCKLWLCRRYWLGAHVILIRSSHYDLAMLTGGKKPRWHLAHATARQKGIQGLVLLTRGSQHL